MTVRFVVVVVVVVALFVIVVVAVVVVIAVDFPAYRIIICPISWKFLYADVTECDIHLNFVH